MKASDGPNGGDGASGNHDHAGDGNIASRAGDAIKNATGFVADAASNAGGRIADASGRVAEAAGNVGDRVAEATGRVADAAGTAGGHVASVAGNVRDRLPDMETVRHGLQNPIGVIIGAAALGFVAGLFVPISDFERERLRPLADNLAERASDARDELIEHGRSALGETAAAAQEIVEQHAKEFVAALGDEPG